jgi:hypothetical protein
MVLLLPVPAVAALSWAPGSNWTITTGSPTQNVSTTLGTGYGTVTGEVNWLFVQPTVFTPPEPTFTTITLQRDFQVSPAGTVSATAVLNNLNIQDAPTGNVQVAVWTTTGTTNEKDIIGSSTTFLTDNNQFPSNHTGISNGTPFLPNTTYTLHVKLLINSTNFSLPSTDSQIVFQFNSP